MCGVHWVDVHVATQEGTLEGAGPVNREFGAAAGDIPCLKRRKLTW